MKTIVVIEDSGYYFTPDNIEDYLKGNVEVVTDEQAETLHTGFGVRCEEIDCILNQEP